MLIIVSRLEGAELRILIIVSRVEDADYRQQS
jgi:hypothetical protein